MCCRQFTQKNIYKLFLEDNEEECRGIDLPRRVHCLNTFLLNCEIQLENSERTTALCFTEARNTTLSYTKNDDLGFSIR